MCGTAPPTTLSTNSKPEPRGSGSTSMSHTAYWPWPPDCFTCRPWPLAAAAERLPQRHLDRLGVQLDAARAEPVEDHVGVRLAHRPEHQLVGLDVALQAQRRVAGHEPAQVLREGVLVRAGLGHHGDRQQRLRHRPRRHQQRVVLAGERVAGLRAARLGDRAEVAGDAMRHLAQRSRRAASRRAPPARRRRGRGGRARPCRARRRAAPARGAGCRRRPGPATPGRRAGRSWS